MSRISDFMCLGVLAEAEDFFKIIGPLLIFGLYIVGSLAKGWTKGSQQESEEEPSELRKAVQRRYQEIHQRQTGDGTARKQPATVHPSRLVEPTMPARQPSQRTCPTYPVQVERHRRPVRQQQNHLSQNRRQKPASVKAKPPKQVRKTQAVRSAKSKCADHSLSSMIRNPQSLRTAIILKEILDKPLALREF